MSPKSIHLNLGEFLPTKFEVFYCLCSKVLLGTVGSPLLCCELPALWCSLAGAYGLHDACIYDHLCEYRADQPRNFVGILVLLLGGIH